MKYLLNNSSDRVEIHILHLKTRIAVVAISSLFLYCINKHNNPDFNEEYLEQNPTLDRTY